MDQGAAIDLKHSSDASTITELSVAFGKIWLESKRRHAIFPG
jgi:hypothetical protein